MGIGTGGISRIAAIFKNVTSQTPKNNKKKALGQHESLSPYAPNGGHAYPRVSIESQQRPTEPMMPPTAGPSKNRHQVPPQTVQQFDPNLDKDSFMQKMELLNLDRTEAYQYRPTYLSGWETPMASEQKPTIFPKETRPS